MNRRGFLGNLLVALAAPSIVRAASIMPIRTPLWMPASPTYINISPLSGTLRVGDVITFEGFEMVHRFDGRRLGVDRQFVVTAVAGAGSAELSIYPHMTRETVAFPRLRKPPTPVLVASNGLMENQ